MPVQFNAFLSPILRLRAMKDFGEVELPDECGVGFVVEHSTEAFEVVFFLALALFAGGCDSDGERSHFPFGTGKLCNALSFLVGWQKAIFNFRGAEFVAKKSSPEELTLFG